MLPDQYVRCVGRVDFRDDDGCLYTRRCTIMVPTDRPTQLCDDCRARALAKKEKAHG